VATLAFVCHGRCGNILLKRYLKQDIHFANGECRLLDIPSHLIAPQP
jgi:hypothetical protein